MKVVAWFRDLVERIAAVVLLLLLGPLMIATSAAIYFSTGGPVLVQRRVFTTDGRAAEVFAFETWLPSGQKSFVGRFIDRYCLNDFPMLINVLRGKMGLQE